MQTRKNVFLFLATSWLLYEEMGPAETFQTHTYMAMFPHYVPPTATSLSSSLGCIFFFFPYLYIRGCSACMCVCILNVYLLPAETQGAHWTL